MARSLRTLSRGPTRGSGDYLTPSYALVAFSETHGSIGLKLNPLGAYSLLGLPLCELTGQVVSLADVFGPDGPRLAERLRELKDRDSRFDALEEFLLRRLCAGPVPDSALVWACSRLGETAGRVRVEALARELGCSRRYLQTRFRQQIGLSPKTAARLLRFADVRRRIRRDPCGGARSPTTPAAPTSRT